MWRLFYKINKRNYIIPIVITITMIIHTDRYKTSDFLFLYSIKYKISTPPRFVYISITKLPPRTFSVRIGVI